MSGESDMVPAGWYPAPNGGQRYWDGRRWLALPDPDDSTVVTGSAVKAPGRTKKRVIASLVALIVLAVAGIGILLWKNSHDTQMRNAAIASSSKAAADAEADRIQRDNDAKRAQRAATVKDIETSIKTLAQKHVADGLFEGPVLSVSCDPIGGGSTDDLTAKTTVFDCFVATKNNGDGTSSGKKYHATMNWDTGDYTYGFGAPR
jgi:hypothetical protein